jgi:putative tricarboxylic transport membrane protein
MRTADIFGGLIGILISLYAIWEGTNMPPDLVMKIGPSFFPTILAGILMVFSIVLIANALRGRSIGVVEALKLSDKGVQRGLTTVAAALVFCVALEPVGFIPSAILFLTFMMVVLGNRKPLQLLIAPPLVTVSVWLIFEKVLHLSMPVGLLARFI